MESSSPAGAVDPQGASVRLEVAARSRPAERTAATGGFAAPRGCGRMPECPLGRARKNLHPEQVAHLEEESVVGPAQPGSKRVMGIHRVPECAPVAREQHRARVWLVGKQQVAPERPVVERGGPDEVSHLGVEDEQRRLGAGVVPQGVLPLAGVLTDQAEEYRAARPGTPA